MQTQIEINATIRMERICHRAKISLNTKLDAYLREILLSMTFMYSAVIISVLDLVDVVQQSFLNSRFRFCLATLILSKQ